MQKIKNGYYVVVEGIDGLSKTTQSSICSEILSQDYEVLHVKEPSDETKNKLFEQGGLDNLNLDEVFDLYLQDHINLQKNIIKKSLKSGKLIIQDRILNYSHKSYWGKDGDVHLQRHEQEHPECIIPNLVIVFVGDPTLAVKRIEGRSIEKARQKPWSNIISLDRIQRRYLDIAAQNPDNFIVFLIDEGKTEKEISDYVLDMIRFKIKKHMENF